MKTGMISSFTSVYRSLLSLPFISSIFGKKAIRHSNYKAINPDLVISGFPRSANTYLTVVVKTRLQDIGINLNILSHDHTVDAVMYSKEGKRPCVVLVRNPHEAILSTYIYFDRKKEIKELIEWYVEFYGYVKEHPDDFLVVRYEDAINDTNHVVHSIGKRIGIEIPAVDDIQKEKKRVFEIMNDHSREIKRGKMDHVRQIGYPNEERARLKELWEQQVKETIKNNGAIEELYETIVANLNSERPVPRP